MAKQVFVNFTDELYRRFSGSKLRRESATDAEAVRGAIRMVLDIEGQKQAANSAQQCSNSPHPAA
jgi:hypothetical protein